MEENNSLDCKEEDNSFNCKEIVKNFINSYATTEECAAECVKRYRELQDNVKAYVDCLSRVFADPRLVPVIYMRNIGIVVRVGDEKDIFMELKAGDPEGVERASHE